ncbi:MAG: hypothetical protein KDD62_07215, partial [Bdellovibrionales bacterium]|nr:hypothetical protein [Bdellovibrionales bacterium]
MSSTELQATELQPQTTPNQGEAFQELLSTLRSAKSAEDIEKAIALQQVNQFDLKDPILTAALLDAMVSIWEPALELQSQRFLTQDQEEQFAEAWKAKTEEIVEIKERMRHTLYDSLATFFSHRIRATH